MITPAVALPSRTSGDTNGDVTVDTLTGAAGAATLPSRSKYATLVL